MLPRVPYLDPVELAHLVRVHRNTGRRSDELAEALSRIAGGVWDRYRFTREREDFVQETVLHLIQKPLRKADVQRNCFNYFTTCAIRFGLKLRDQDRADRRRHATYAAELLESGRPVLMEDAGETRRRGQVGIGVVGRHGSDRSPDEELESRDAEQLAGELLAALDGIRDELAATRPPRRTRPASKRARRRRRRAT